MVKIVSVLALASLLGATGLSVSGAAAANPQAPLMGLNHVAVVASTVDAQNQDQNPYGVTLDTFKGTSTAPNPYYGDLLVSNFSNNAGVNGAGSTIEAINPKTGSVTQFASSASGPVALAVSPKGPVWIANFGTSGTNGNVEVLAPNGKSFEYEGSNSSIITSSLFGGPWGQVFVPNATAPAFLVTNALTGTIDAMYGFAPPSFNTDTKITVIGQGLAHNGTTANNVQGPQGMVYDSATHMVYVTDTADNSIRGFYWDGANTPNQGEGQLIYQGGALNAPAGITLNPLNGDLLVVNQGNNHLVALQLNSTDTSATVVGQRVLDHTPVNPRTGAGSALFGVYATEVNGHVVVYFTDDNTNTVDMLY
ncbi:MAG: NHL repeat-containing protein [Sulfobacillus sp.]